MLKPMHDKHKGEYRRVGMDDTCDLDMSGTPFRAKPLVMRVDLKGNTFNYDE